jgi:hypothetical protein
MNRHLTAIIEKDGDAFISLYLEVDIARQECTTEATLF